MTRPGPAGHLATLPNDDLTRRESNNLFKAPEPSKPSSCTSTLSDAIYVLEYSIASQALSGPWYLATPTAPANWWRCSTTGIGSIGLRRVPGARLV